MNSSGTDEYISHIVRTYSQTLYRIALTALHSSADAEDAVQEVFITLLKKQPEFKSTEHEKAWLIRVTVNTARNMRKRLSRCESHAELPEITTEQRCDSLISAVLELPTKYSTVIHLFYYEDYSIKEISSILQLPAATVGTRLTRGRALLKNKLTGDDTFD